jgi:hypothetical protein
LEANKLEVSCAEVVKPGKNKKINTAILFMTLLMRICKRSVSKEKQKPLQISRALKTGS